MKECKYRYLFKCHFVCMSLKKNIEKKEKNIGRG